MKHLLSIFLFLGCISLSYAEIRTEDISTVDLMRFAFQSLYAPLRLVPTDSPYIKSPIHTELFVSNLIAGDKVVAHPVESWMAGGRYVTAVALQNKQPYSIFIDIKKEICGDWQAAILYPRSTLMFHGEPIKDSTLLFLVSQKSFSETIGMCHGHA
jgi:hypothetical protein